MPGLGAKLFANATKLFAEDINGYLADQTIMRFPTISARDNAFGGIGEPVLSEGMTCYIDADNTIYTFDGVDWIRMVSASNPVGFEYIGSWSATSGTSLTLTNCFSSAYRNYRLNISGYSNGTTNAGLNIRFSGNATNYKLGGTYAPTNAAAGLQRYGSGITTVSDGALGFITQSGGRCAGTVEIFDPFVNDWTHYISTSSHAVSDNAIGPSWVSGWHILAQSHTSAEIRVTSGAFQNIECRMYGYRD